jgi:hypothetical protein
VTKFRFVAVHPDRPALWKLGAAAALHDLLIDNQTDPQGRVFYGHPISYAWLYARWPGNPDERPVIRTLQRYMAKLKRAGLVQVRRAGMSDGMRVVLLGSAKWANAAPPPPVQMPLYAPKTLSISRGRPVEKQRKSDTPATTDVSFTRRQMCRRKEVRSKPEEKITVASLSHAMPRVQKTQDELAERRRLLREQAEALQEKFPVREKTKAAL